MAKKRKEEDEVERLEKEIRELKTINRSLLKRLRKVDKGFDEFIKDKSEDKNPKLHEKYEEEKKHPDCPDCRKGFIVKVNIAGRIFNRCDLCGWRTKTEKTPS